MTEAFTGEIYKDYRFDVAPLHFKASDEDLYKQFITAHAALYQKYQNELKHRHEAVVNAAAD